MCQLTGCGPTEAKSELGATKDLEEKTKLHSKDFYKVRFTHFHNIETEALFHDGRDQRDMTNPNVASWNTKGNTLVGKSGKFK